MLRQWLGHYKGRLATILAARQVLSSWGEAIRFGWCGQKKSDAFYTAHYRKLPFQLRWRDWAGVREVMIENEYGIVLQCLAKQEAPVILDLGANIGAFSLYNLAHFPAAHVHAYEASATTFKLIEASRALNPLLNWHVHHAAAWHDNGTVTFENAALSTGSRVAASGGETVPARDLPTILAATGVDHIHLLKADIEGAEEALFAGHASSLSRIDHVIVELHPGRCNTDLVVETLRAAYSHVYVILGRRSSKPLLLATRQSFNLPLYAGT